MPGLAEWTSSIPMGVLCPGCSSNILSVAGSHLRFDVAKLKTVERVSPGIGVKIASVSGDL